MSETIKGRNVRVEVALTFSAAVAIDGVSKANPGVATEATHTFVAGEVGFWTVATGMTELDGQANVVGTVATNTFTLPGLNTTNYSTWVAGAGNVFTKAATWGLVEESKGYVVGGGAADLQDDTRLNDVKRRNVSVLLAAQDMRLSVAPAEVDSTAMAFVDAAAKANSPCLFKITSMATGKILRVAYGVPSTYDENLDVGGLATGGISVTAPGWVVKPNV